MWKKALWLVTNATSIEKLTAAWDAAAKAAESELCDRWCYVCGERKQHCGRGQEYDFPLVKPE